MTTTDDSLARLAARLNALLQDTYGREPRWRYFAAPDNGPWFGWYVEAPTEGHRAGMYASFVYAPTGRGSRSGRAQRWEYVDAAEGWHTLRKDAKARALRLSRAYKAGDRTPWR
jgi:hypothetical protein